MEKTCGVLNSMCSIRIVNSCVPRVSRKAGSMIAGYDGTGRVCVSTRQMVKRDDGFWSSVVSWTMFRMCRLLRLICITTRDIIV